MAMYALRPEQFSVNNCKWRHSASLGNCMIVATSERQARLIAARKLWVGEEILLNNLAQYSPWLDAELVKVIESAILQGMDPPAGTLLFPREPD